MTFRLKPVIFICALLAGMPLMGNSQTNPTVSSRAYLQLAKKSLSESAKEVSRKTGCRVVSAKKVKKNGREQYKIKVLCKDGTVRVHTINPGNG